MGLCDELRGQFDLNTMNSAGGLLMTLRCMPSTLIVASVAIQRGLSRKLNISLQGVIDYQMCALH